LRKFLPGHEVTSVQREGFGGKGNGELLALLDGNFDLFLLCTQSLRYQQNLAGRIIAIIELPPNRWPALQSPRERIIDAVASSSKGIHLAVDELILLSVKQPADATAKDSPPEGSAPCQCRPVAAGRHDRKISCGRNCSAFLDRAHAPKCWPVSSFVVSPDLV
jgi:hypothetical protein